MLLGFVIIYWIVSVAIGIYAARWVHNTKDYAVAGRRMPVLRGRGGAGRGQQCRGERDRDPGSGNGDRVRL